MDIASKVYPSYVGVMNNLENAVRTAYSYNPAALNTLINLNGKVVRIGSNGSYKYYTINVGTETVNEEVIAPVSVYNIL